MDEQPKFFSLRAFAGSFFAWGGIWMGLALWGDLGVIRDGRQLPWTDAEVLRLVASQVLPFAVATPFLLAAGNRLAMLRPPRQVLWSRLSMWVFVCALASAFTQAISNGWHSMDWQFLKMATFSWSMPYAALAFAGLAIGQRRLAERDRRAVVEARLRALRAQLQPHFLFNTLQGISTSVRQSPDTAVRMIALLGDLLRQTLHEREHGLVTLADEQALLEPYLELQRLRFADRLQIDLDLPADTLSAAVPDLVLQPLVENALQHGVERRPGAAAITIRARRRGKQLELTVADDGAGPPAQHGDGIGLGSTRERLRALFGNAAAVELAPAAGRGTVVTVRLPFVEQAHAA
jgi:two-component sensor histidine kinase